MKRILASLVALGLTSAFGFAQSTPSAPLSPPASVSAPEPFPSLIQSIRHELSRMPNYSVFDWLEFRTSPDGVVTLEGETYRPSNKSEAERRVRRLPGVSSVVNEIETLPPSPFDDQTRVAVYQVLYGPGSPLFRYGNQLIPSIHILVKNGHVRLLGFVDTNFDKEIAGVRADRIPGIFSVENDLIVARADSKSSQ